MKRYIGLYILIGLLVVALVGVIYISRNNVAKVIEVNITDATMVKGKDTVDIKRYTQDDYDSFIADYNNGNLDDIYITEFLFDGAGMYKTYDLDDFIEEGNDTEVKVLSITNYNVNTTGNIKFTGSIVGGMISVNTNDIKGDINILLNGVNIDTDSKKVPAILVYNKDIMYTTHKVTINALEGTTNYIEGGKLKKVSLIPTEELSNYTNNYSNDYKTYYSEYTNYYGVYTKDEIDKVLFAKVEADREDLADGDPYYFYKAAGAISSDIDLYFEGKGTLSVVSKNKEGIETKGNLTFSGGTGDYYIEAQDDCLNTTTDGNNYRNELTIDVNSLVAIVSLDADEGDAIDSNGTLTINGGTIIAIAKPGQDAGLDSNNGTLINGGTVIATGDMYDEISSESKQNFIALSFSGNVSANDVITLLDSNEKAIFAYVTDRTYTNLVYSSASLVDGTYNLYKGGEPTGDTNKGFIANVTSYSKGTLLGYSNTGMQGGMGAPMGDNQNNGNMPEPPSGDLPIDMQNNNQNRPAMPDNQGNAPEPPSGEQGERPELPSGEVPNMNEERPELPNGEQGEMPTDGNMPSMTNGEGGMSNATATNRDFTVNGISNLFSGVAIYSE